MGIFDIFKKKEKQNTEQVSEALRLEYSDGTIASIEFAGLTDMDGKMLHTANILYTNSDGTFKGRKVLLEPIMRQGEDGNWLDATEQYYRQLSTRDGSKESQASYNAVKGFFKNQDIAEEIIGSNYIGNLARNESGQYFRYYDNDFRQKYTIKCREEKQNQIITKQEKQDEFISNLKNQVNDRPVHVKTSHAEHLTPQKNPYLNR